MNRLGFLRNKLWNLTEEQEYNYPERFQHRIRIIDNVLLERVYGRVLEVGCGEGRFLIKLKNAGGITSIWGVDISINAVEVAHERGFDIIRANGEKLPFKNEVFDAVTSANGSPKEMDMKLLLSEVYRVLKPGGYFSFDTYNKDPLEKIVKYKIMYFLNITKRSFSGIAGGITDIEKFKTICLKSGFEIISLYTLLPLPFSPYGILLKGKFFCQTNTHLIGVIRKTV